MIKPKIAIAGINGRMGQAIFKAVSENPMLHLSCTTTRAESLSTDFDVLIDFTSPSATLDHIAFCIAHHKKIVIGTTGFTNDQLLMIQKSSMNMPIVMSPNMGIGVNIFFEVLTQVSILLNKQYNPDAGDILDIHILDAHHRHKVDAPSGTALRMKQCIAQALPSSFPAIECSSIRAGDIVGDHSALFAIQGERLEITHKASDRSIFAQGSVKAAQWLAQKSEPGLYTMREVLDL